jgi:hypothetical protein
LQLDIYNIASNYKKAVQIYFKSKILFTPGYLSVTNPSAYSQFIILPSVEALSVMVSKNCLEEIGVWGSLDFSK